MSRSFKKVWGFKKTYKYGKRSSNKKIRKTKDLDNSKEGIFKKAYSTYDIKGFKTLCFTKKLKRDIIKNKENLYTDWWRWRNK